MSIFNKIFAQEEHEANQSKIVFDELMKFAREMAETYPHALVDLVKLYGRKRQSELMLAPLVTSDRVPSKYDVNDAWFSLSYPITESGESLFDLRKDAINQGVVDLANTLVLPSPRVRNRLLKYFGQYGPGEKRNPWIQHDQKIHYWLPLGIAWVTGGNHTITCAVVQGEGHIDTAAADDIEVYDISNVYEYVRCDGVNFYRRHDNSVINEVQDPEMAAIFEIGRLMVDHEISA